MFVGVEEADGDDMMNLVQEAHIASVDVGDDRLGDDEWNLLSNTASLVTQRHFTSPALSSLQQCYTVLL